MAGSSNMYRVGDYVYFEPSSMQPYQIRRIEELNKTSSGGVEARVTCLFRRRDVSSNVSELADKHHAEALQQFDGEKDENKLEGLAKLNKLSDEHKHLLKHKELFLSRQIEVLPATHIRGKCSVNLLNEAEDLEDYLNKPDTFFYLLIYDPHQKTLSSDQNEIDVGSEYQSEIPELLKDGEDDGRDQSNLETLVFSPDNSLEEKQIEDFIVICRSVGTFARAVDTAVVARQPSLHLNAGNASRDITTFHAMDILHKSDYDLVKALGLLVLPKGPLLCRDEFEDWSATEAELFEEALAKYGKDFLDIRQDFLMWRSLKSIVEYYYFWKTSDRYVKHKREKAAEGDNKLKQVYIPAFNKPSPALVTNVRALQQQAAAGLIKLRCESCNATESQEWYGWGQTQSYKICGTCWAYWKHYGGLKKQTGLDGEQSSQQYVCTDCKRPFFRLERLRQHREMAHRIYHCTVQGCDVEFPSKQELVVHCEKVHNLMLSLAGAGNKTLLRSRYSFYLFTTPLTRYARYICNDIVKIETFGRHPFKPLDFAVVKQTLKSRSSVENVTIDMLKGRTKPRKYPKLNDVANKLSEKQQTIQQIPKSPRRGVMGNIKHPSMAFGNKNRELYSQQITKPVASISPSGYQRSNVTVVNGVVTTGVKRPASDAPNNGLDVIKRARNMGGQNGMARPHQHIRKDDGGISYMFSIKRRRKGVDKLRGQVEEKMLKKASRRPDFIVERHLKQVGLKVLQ